MTTRMIAKGLRAIKTKAGLNFATREILHNPETGKFYFLDHIRGKQYLKEVKPPRALKVGAILKNSYLQTMTEKKEIELTKNMIP